VALARPTTPRPPAGRPRGRAGALPGIKTILEHYPAQRAAAGARPAQVRATRLPQPPLSRCLGSTMTGSGPALRPGGSRSTAMRGGAPAARTYPPACQALRWEVPPEPPTGFPPAFPAAILRVLPPGFLPGFPPGFLPERRLPKRGGSVRRVVF
jgi:hypothetical protein